MENKGFASKKGKKTSISRMASTCKGCAHRVSETDPRAPRSGESAALPGTTADLFVGRPPATLIQPVTCTIPLCLRSPLASCKSSTLFARPSLSLDERALPTPTFQPSSLSSLLSLRMRRQPLRLVLFPGPRAVSSAARGVISRLRRQWAVPSRRHRPARRPSVLCRALRPWEAQAQAQATCPGRPDPLRR